MSLADLALNAHKTYTDAIDREDDAREIFYRYVTYNRRLLLLVKNRSRHVPDCLG